MLTRFFFLLSLFIFSSTSLWSSWSYAKIFRNSYVSFELPSNWKCLLEQTEWVCRSEYKQQAKEAIIILTAKMRGPTDSFSAYMNHLKVPRSVVSKKGGLTKSKVLHTKDVKINNYRWIDGWQLGSELPPYYTRYMVTVKDKLAVLVTFSAHKKHYTRYSKDFFNAIKSLRVIASKGLLQKPSSVNIRPGSEAIGTPIGQIMGQELGDDLEENLDGSGSSGSSDIFLALGFLLIAIGGYIFYKKRKG